MKRYSNSNSSALSKVRKPKQYSPAATARRAVLKRIERRELQKLQTLLPPSVHRQRRLLEGGRRRRDQQASDCDDELAVVRNATRYIHHLQASLVARIQNGTLTVPLEVLSSILNQHFLGVLNNQSTSSSENSSSNESSRKSA